MKPEPLVSAVIPTYNRARVVSEAIDSVLGQTYPHVEVIVVDDGSTDDTLEMLKSYGDRIRLVSQENRGPAAARNRGVAASRGEIIAFLDSDDLWLPTKLERQVELLQKTPDSVPCCLCNITMRWSEKELQSFGIARLDPQLSEGIWLNVDEVLATRFVLFNQGIAIRREVLEKLGGFDESLRLLEDHDLALRLSLEGPWAFIREPLVIWRETKGSLYHNAQFEEIKTKEPRVRILEKFLAILDQTGKRRGLHRHLRRELKRSRRQLKAARMSQMNSRFSAALGNVLRKIEQFRNAFFRRSPLFPKMKAQELKSWQCDIAK